MIKKLICIILSVTLFTGCSNSPKVLLKYNDNSTIINYTEKQASELNTADYFAKDLCIIPDKLNHMNNAAITATSALIINSTENKALFSHNIYERMYPASLTKLITALVVLEKADLSDVVTISKNAAGITESGAKLCGFQEGDKVTLETLLNCLLVYSGNDAGLAIAEHVGGSEEGFAKMMNEAAKEVGAVHSNFVNPHGLHNDNHYTTAYDLYLIFHQLIQNDKFLSIIHQAVYTASYTDASDQPVRREFANTNRYLKGTEKAPEGITVMGGKTGTTDKAGNCLVLYSKDKENNSYISIVLQAESGNSLFYQMTSLLKMID